MATLRAHGISEAKARRNLQSLLPVVCAIREQRIHDAFETANFHAQRAEYPQGISALEHLVRDLPATDSRYEGAQKLLAQLREVAANAAKLENAEGPIT